MSRQTRAAAACDRAPIRRWLPAEEERFLASIRRHGWGKWKLIAADVGTKTNAQVKGFAWNVERSEPGFRRRHGGGEVVRGGKGGGGRAEGEAESGGSERPPSPSPPSPSRDDDAPAPEEAPRAAPAAAEEEGPTKKKRRRRQTSYHGLPSAETLHETGWAKVPKSTRHIPPAARGAYKELVVADEERTEARATLESAREALDDAAAHLAWAEGRAADAEERFRTAQAEVEEADLRREESGQVGRWNERFERLEAFHAVHGHCRVRHVPGWRDDPGLVELERFISRAKSSYRNYEKGLATTLRPHRILALERLGVFVSKWDVKFRELLAFKEEHGHCNVPTRGSANPKLGNWVGYLRTEYKKLKDGKISQMSEERIRRLEEVGFCFNLYEARGIKREPYDNRRKKQPAAEKSNEDDLETEVKPVEDSEREEKIDEDLKIDEEPEEDSELALYLG